MTIRELQSKLAKAAYHFGHDADIVVISESADGKDTFASIDTFEVITSEGVDMLAVSAGSKRSYSQPVPHK